MTIVFVVERYLIQIIILCFLKVSDLVKELVVMGELNQQQKDTIQKLTLAESQNPESSMQLHCCHRELGGKNVQV